MSALSTCNVASSRLQQYIFYDKGLCNSYSTIPTSRARFLVLWMPWAGIIFCMHIYIYIYIYIYRERERERDLLID